MVRGAALRFEGLIRFDEDLAAGSQGPLAGVDEAGRGALAGPVVAAAVICEPDDSLSRVRDSKKLSEAVREELFEVIRRRSTAWAVGIVPSSEIDRINILNATMKAMKEAVRGLAVRPALVVVDGNRAPGTGLDEITVKGGDDKSFSVAAASIMAKVTRDRMMRASEHDYPGYGFSRHKGYGTEAHMSAIRTLGRCALHRMSFSMGKGSGEEREWTQGKKRGTAESG